jgi:GNAT superfamily N-acetyltransferase
MTFKAIDAVISGEPEAVLITRGGLVLSVRPVTTEDGPLLAEFFERVDADDLRFRFLSGQEHARPHQIAEMIEVDHRRAEHLLAFDADSKEMVASAMLVADNCLENAEVAIAIAKAYRGQGIGWTMLKHVAELAKVHGIKRLRSIESCQNHAALEVERALGFSTCAFDGDPTLLLVEASLA